MKSTPVAQDIACVISEAVPVYFNL